MLCAALAATVRYICRHGGDGGEERLQHFILTAFDCAYFEEDIQKAYGAMLALDSHLKAVFLALDTNPWSFFEPGGKADAPCVVFSKRWPAGSSSIGPPALVEKPRVSGVDDTVAAARLLQATAAGVGNPPAAGVGSSSPPPYTP